MEYNKLVAVSGLPGLYELINSKSDGAIVRSLDDKSTRFISNRIHNFSSLESIEVFTVNENVNLAEVFFAMEKSGDPLPDTKDDAVVKKYFEKTFPSLDFEKVYSSDLKKMVKWFDVLKKKEIEIKLPEIPEEPELEEAIEEAPVEAKKSAPAPAKKAESAKEKSKPAQKEEMPEKKKPAAKTEKKPAAKSGPAKKSSSADNKKSDFKKGKK